MPCEWCTGPRLDVLLDVMRSSPQVLQFVPHICQHAEELGVHLEVLADHIDELGVCTGPCDLLVPLDWRCARPYTAVLSMSALLANAQHRVHNGCWSATTGWGAYCERVQQANLRK